MTLSHHVIVEQMAAVEAADRLLAGESAVWFSTTPMVAERLRAEGRPFVWLDTLLPEGLSDGLGEAAWRFASGAIDLLEPACARIGWADLAKFSATPLQRLAATLLFKAEALKRWRALPAGRRIVAGDTVIAIQSGGTLGLGFYDTLYAALSERLFGGDVELVKTAPVDTRALLAEIDRPILTDRLLSMTDFSADLIASRAMRFLRGAKPFRLRGGGPSIAILRDNESIRGMLPSLLWRGCEISHLPRQPVPASADPLPSLPDAAELGALLAKCLKSTGASTDGAVVAAFIAEALREASRYWASALRQADKTIRDTFSSGAPSILVTSTIGGIANHALAERANERGVPVCVVEHGVSAGLSEYHKPVRPFSEAAPSQLYLVVSSGAEKFFRDDPALSDCDVRTIGLPRQTRTVPNRWLQRPLARLRMGARRGDRVVMYVTRHVQNNLRMLPHTPEDHEVHALQRTMADDVMPKLRGLPVIKLYGTRRYRDPDPMAGAFAAPAPVKTFQAGDFRFLRAGADLFILESPLSTLGWAMGAGKPVCYLDQPALPLLPDARDAMREALLFFDMAQAGWRERLVASLNRPDDEILAEWWAKAPARERFLDRYVFGPDNAGRNGADAVVGAALAGMAVRHDDKPRLAAE